MTTALTADRPKLTATTPLSSPFWLGRLRLANRIVMAPLTRARALASNYFPSHTVVSARTA